MGKKEIPKQKFQVLNYAMLHYHCGPSGVRTVMENDAVSLFEHGGFGKLNISFIGNVISNKKYVATFEIPGRSIVNIDMNEMDRNFKQFKSKKELMNEAKKLKDKIIGAIPLDECTFENPFYVHTHNMNLGRSPVVSLAVYLLAEWAVNKPVVIIIQIHDFAENGRYSLLRKMQHCTGKFDNDFAVKIMYPLHKSVVYAAINPGDVKNLRDIGIPKDRVFLLPNAIDVRKFEQKALHTIEDKKLKKMGIKRINFPGKIREKIKKFADKHDFLFDPDHEIILAPLKCMRRKNIAESILLTLLLGKKYQLVVTMDPNTGVDKDYSTKIKKFVKKHKLPVVIGIGDYITSPVADRIIEKGIIKFFNMHDLFELSHAVITSSLVEGFGFVYHEGWLTDKFVFGRKLPYVTNAFEEAGMDFNHMYIKINIDPKWINLERIKKLYFNKINSLRGGQGYPNLKHDDFELLFKQKKMKGGFIDFGDLDLISQKIFISKLSKYQKDLIKINPHLDPVLRIRKDVIGRNRKVCKKKYNLAVNAKHLLELFEAAKKLVKTPIKRTKLDNGSVIIKYIDLENIRLLI